MAVMQLFRRFFAPPVHPRRLQEQRRFRLFAALGASLLASLVFLAAYYATLGLLPSASAYTATEYPVSAWAHRLDLAQFLGTLLYPPVPSPLTWRLGLAALLGTFVTLGLVYAILLAWSLQGSSLLTGIVFGTALFVGLAATLSIANGVHPAVMRNSLPDTGLLLLGWSSLATLQLLLVHWLYGGALGLLYQRLSIQK